MPLNDEFSVVGWVRFYQHRPWRGSIKQVSIRKQPEGYFICISVVQEHEVLPASENQAVSIDLGVARLATLFSGEWFDNPRLFERFSGELKRLQRKLSRQVQGSNGRQKTRRHLGRLHARIRRCRREHANVNASKNIRDLGRVSGRKYEQGSRALPVSA